MNRLARCLLFLAAVATCHALESVRPGISYTEPAVGAPVLHGLSGSPLPIPLNLVAPLGSSCSLDCELFQAGEELAARLPGGGELIPDMSFSDRTLQSLEVQVAMPEVERETTVIVRFSLKSKPDGKVLASTKVPIRLLPGSESPFNPITRLKGLPEGSLLVTGESPRLRSFFDKMKIRYVDGVEISTGISSVVLCEGNDVPSHVPDGLPVIHFSNSDRLLPGVYESLRSGAQRIKVTLPILDSVSSNVLAQATLADLIFSSLPTQPNHE